MASSSLTLKMATSASVKTVRPILPFALASRVPRSSIRSKELALTLYASLDQS
jgi:hypothetical protein